MGKMMDTAAGAAFAKWGERHRDALVRWHRIKTTLKIAAGAVVAILLVGAAKGWDLSGAGATVTRLAFISFGATTITAVVVLISMRRSGRL